MSRREQREQIFKILFGVEFHSADELDYIWGIWETSAKKMPTI